MEKTVSAFWQKNRLVIKAVFIGILTLLLLIPMAFITSLVNERKIRHDAAAGEVSGKWASSQTLTGPIVVIPYQSFYKDETGKTATEIKQAYFLPDSLLVEGDIQPEKRHRGIYEVILYRSDLQITGAFAALDPESLKIPQDDWLPDQAYLVFGVDDMRGIENRLAVQWNDSLEYFDPGMPQNSVLKQGVYVPLKLDWPDLAKGTFRFSIHLRLKGSGDLHVIPLGKNTQVSLRSPWTTPSFTGNFLPDTYHINNKGFTAGWNIFNLNRNLPQHWATGSYDLEASSFGVSLMLPVDMYQKTMRCVKYAILIIVLTFIVFFLVETSQKKPVHPFQYILIGFALCIFYTLLMSLSEYIQFNGAYIIAAAAVVGLVSLYARWIFGSRGMSLLIGGTLLILYGFIFTLVQLQDFSLLFGSIGLFIALAMLMYYSRSINRVPAE
jgi:inner membrane protein